MPEGPEIRRAARAVGRAVVGQPLHITFVHPKLAAMAQALRGATVVGVTSRSKAMLTAFSTGDVLYSHNQLYGEWVVAPAGAPLLARAVRLVLDTPEHRVVLYSATDFAWLRAGHEAEQPYLAKLGPDVLDDATTVTALRQRLAAFPRRRIGDALLDQGVLAGLGNYLRSEIAFVARLSPWRRLGELTPPELQRLAHAARALARRSLRTGGVCVPDALYRQQRGDGAAFEEARFFVFDREHRPCRACARPIERAPLAGRGVFFCATCQPDRPSTAD